MLYRLATVGAPRGLRGEVRLILHTDNPHERLAAGSRVHTDPDRGTLTIADLIERGGTFYVRFEGYPDRTAVEALVHTELLAEGVAEEDAWYEDELTGLRAQRPGGEVIGIVAGLEHYPAHDMLVVTETGGQRTLIPLVREIVTEVDLVGGYVVVAAPHGLLAADGEVE